MWVWSRADGVKFTIRSCLPTTRMISRSINLDLGTGLTVLWPCVENAEGRKAGETESQGTR